MSDVTFGTWSVPASPIIVEYSVVVVEEIRHEVAEGFQKLSRGGIEVGGLLYGVHEGPTVRITAIRASACEHAAGPAFRLSERDRATLREQLRLDREDPRLKGLECVGWYVSHTRSEITLTESDQEIFNTYFGQPWQVALVVRPSRGGNMRAGFFVRNEDGSLAPTQSHLEFNFPDRMAGMPEHRVPFSERRPPEPRASYRAVEQTIPVPPEAPRVSAAASAAPVSSIPTSTMSSPGMTSLFGEPATPQESPDLASKNGTDKSKAGGGKKWIWLTAVLIIIAAMVAAGARYLSFPVPNESMALSVLEREGQLNIEWNRSAAPISKAVRGTLEIADGTKSQTIPLGPTDLAQGKFAYKRATGDIQVRMSVEAPNGTKLQEASRFLGPPPSAQNADELKALEQRRDELDAEVTRLKQSNDQQAQRIQQLERTFKNSSDSAWQLGLSFAMRIPIYQVDAFASELFRGNPAAVCPLDHWLKDETLQAIAAENNLAETAYYVNENGRYRLRWFTPAIEVDLCGHATLATAHVILDLRMEIPGQHVAFDSRSGELTVARENDLYVMDFPSVYPPETADDPALFEALGARPSAFMRTGDCFCVFETEDQIRALAPDMSKLAKVDCRGVIVTAPGKDCDFVSRFFAPRAGIPEDPVTGSAHTNLIPYWSRRLGKQKLFARQISPRGGELWCEDRGPRVKIGGHAVTYLEGHIAVTGE